MEPSSAPNLERPRLPIPPRPFPISWEPALLRLERMALCAQGLAWRFTSAAIGGPATAWA